MVVSGYMTRTGCIQGLHRNILARHCAPGRAKAVFPFIFLPGLAMLGRGGGWKGCSLDQAGGCRAGQRCSARHAAALGSGK